MCIFKLSSHLIDSSARVVFEPALFDALQLYSSASSPKMSLTTNTCLSPSLKISYLLLGDISRVPLNLKLVKTDIIMNSILSLTLTR